MFASLPGHLVPCQPFCEMCTAQNCVQPVPSLWQGKRRLKMRKQFCFGSTFCPWVTRLHRGYKVKLSLPSVYHFLVLVEGEHWRKTLSISYLVTSVVCSGYVCYSLTLCYLQGRNSTTSSICLGRSPWIVAPSLLRLQPQ